MTLILHFAGKRLLGLTDFMRKIQLRNSVLRVEIFTVASERKKSKKKVSARAMTCAFIYDSSNRFLLELARNGLKHFCDGFLVHNTWRSDLLKGLACSDSAVFFHLPKKQAEFCLGSLFQSFSVGRWVAKELRTVHITAYLHFIDDVTISFVYEYGFRPELGFMESFLSCCPGLLPKTRIMIMFSLGCLCLDHGELGLPEVNFGSLSFVGDRLDLSEIMEPVPRSLLSRNSECNNFNDASFITDCMDFFRGVFRYCQWSCL